MIKPPFSKLPTPAIVLTISAVIAIVPFANCAALTWVGGAGDWTNAANWNPATAPTFTATNTDDLIFDNTAVSTTVDLRPTTGEEPVRSMTFSPGAPVFTFQRTDSPDAGGSPVLIMGDDTAAPGTGIFFTNNSGVTQTFLSGLEFGSGSSNTIPVTINTGSDTGISIEVQGGGNTGLYFGGIVTINGTGTIHSAGQMNNVGGCKLIMNADVVVDGGIAGSTSGTGSQGLIKLGTGTLTVKNINDVITNRNIHIGVAAATTFANSGAIRISKSNSLGSGTGFTAIYGDQFNNGRMELTNDITLAEPLRIQGREQATANLVSVLSDGGSNTLTGAITFQEGGNRYNLGATAGNSLIISNNQTANLVGDRIFSFDGAGNGNLAASFTLTNSNAAGTMPVLKSGAGAFTVDGAINVNSAAGGTSPDVVVNGGSIVVSATGLISNARGLHVASGATFDASAVVSNITLGTGQTFSTFIQGGGTVKGNVIASAGGAIQAGGTELYDTALGLSPVSSVGHLNFNNDLDLSGGGILNWKLGALSTSGAGTNFDIVTVGGNLALAGSATLSLDFSLLPSGLQPGNGDAFWNSNHSWKIVDAIANAGPTNFATISNGTFGTNQFTTTVGSGPDAGDILLNYVTAGFGGDYNHDSKVDAADYVIWRKDPSGHGNAMGYTTWRGQFGLGSGAGIGSGLSSSAVPEPASVLLTLSMLCISTVTARWKFRR